MLNNVNYTTQTNVFNSTIKSQPYIRFSGSILASKNDDTEKVPKNKLDKFYPPKHNRFVMGGVNKTLSLVAKLINFDVDVKTKEIDALKEKIESSDGVLITPNHAHILDIATLSLGLNKNGVKLTTMGAEELFKKGPFDFSGRVLNRYGVAPVPRGSKDKSKITDVAIGTLDDAEKAFMMLPEGLVSNSNMVLNELKNGASNFATQVVLSEMKEQSDKNVWIVPTSLYYDYENKMKLQARIEKSIDHLEENLIENLEDTDIEFKPLPEGAEYHERLVNLIDYMASSREALYSERYGFPLSGLDNPYSRLAYIRENLLESLYSKYSENGAKRDPNANEDMQAKRLMASLKSDFAESKPKGLKKVGVKLWRTLSLPARLFTKQSKADWVRDVRALKDVTYLTMYPEGYLDPDNIDVQEDIKHVLINRMVEQLTILTRELEGKYTPLYRNKKRFRTPAPISQAWAWRQGDIQAQLKIGEPINVRQFLADYIKNHPGFNYEDKSEKNAMLSDLTLKITEQLSADLQKLEQGVNSDKESDRRVMLAQLDKPH